MLEMKWLYELILVIYGASVMGYFIDFIQYNRKANRIAFWLLSLVWVLQTLFLIYQLLLEDSFPVLNMYDGLYFYAWILVTFSLLINRFFRVDLIVFFTNLLGFFIMLLHVGASAQNQGTERGVHLVSELLIAHISLALLSYGFFTVSFLFSIMYLLQYRLLKEKKGYKWLRRFGGLDRLDTLSFQAVTVGVPILMISIILGIVWAYSSGAEFYWNDFKTMGSMFVLIVYMVHLILRLVKGYQGRTIALYNTGAFLFLLINFFLFSMLSNFHF
ncbi:cytochrome C assembly protein [Sediminibacillus dalangtanensis]|uniref:Cytochrome C assembly protein n=1 Tax=Sediminibacillus dalangtanensis TaxID=2729421 RepID=A0ABX7VW31_9BACI|nr:cytochrome c biogenesis protein [Sediminibacillus dalangtanensis]QTM99985.1 cytochrome C assembly protein [Sediminibacillus dalangtanensis]